MSKFNRFALKLDSVAREIFNQLDNADINLREAERAIEGKEGKERLKAEIALTDAREDYSKAQAEAPTAVTKLSAEIRAELEAELEKAFSVNPEAVDLKAMEILNSGILTASELAKMVSDYASKGNYTMSRLFAKQAEKQLDSVKEPHDRELLSNAVVEGSRTGASEYLDKFNSLQTVLIRCVNNPAMRDRWAEITEDAINAF